MPAIVSFFARQLIIIGVQLGIFTLIDKLVTPLLNKAITAVVEFFGVSEETAKDILANEVITTAESLGLTVALSKARLPLKIAETLGFTTKGFSKRKLASSVESTVAKAKGVNIPISQNLSIQIEELSKVIAGQKGILSQKVKDILLLLSMGIGLPTAVGYVVAQYIDYANWPSGTFHDFFAKLFEKLGLPANQKLPKSAVLSDKIWNKIYNTYKIAGAIGINNPYKLYSVPFTAESLKELVDDVAAHILLEKGSATTKQILAATQGFIVFSSPVTQSKINSIFGVKAETPATPTIKVFTGVVSQGKLGEAADFVPRPDDLIEDVNELQQAATINLSEFIKSLPKRIVYEIKVVSTITTKDGFKQRGTAQQVLVGHFKDGRPKYQTVVNKFATLDIFIFTERNVRTKIATIVLGPVNSAKLVVKPEQIQAIEKNLQTNLVTSDIKEIQSIETPQSVTITPPPTAPAPAPAPTGPTFYIDPSTIQWAESIHASWFSYNAPDGNTYIIRKKDNQWYRESDNALVVTTQPAAPAPAPAAPTVSIPQSNNPNKCLASTIAEFFDVNRLVYPSVEERSKLYEAFGLGKAAYYTGTAEQNIKLLQELKRRSGCQIF